MRQSGTPVSFDGDASPPATGSESARYTKDMLRSLKRIAAAQDQLVLAHLLDAALREADRLLCQPQA